MNLEEAIQTALKYEKMVRDTYRDSVDKIADPAGQRVFKTMAEEEQGHVDYLEAKLAEWRDTGKVTPESLATMVPSKERIDAGVKELKKPLEQAGDRAAELELLKKALAVEVETSNFYQKMVDELPDGERDLFTRFLEIEVGHQTIVQAEIDNVQGLGFWFDFQEFNLEAG